MNLKKIKVKKTITYSIFSLLVIGYLFLGWHLGLFEKSYPRQNTGQQCKKLVLTVPASIMTNAVYRQIIARFEQENPDTKVTFMPISGTYYQKLLVMFAGNIGPDLMWMGQSFGEFAERGLFMDLSSRIRKDASLDLRNYPETILNWYMRNNKRYGIPFGIDFFFIIYNKKLFREEGLPYPKDNWTFNDFIYAAQKLTRRDKKGNVICYGYCGGLMPCLFNAEFISEDGKKILCDSPEMIQYLKTNLALSQKWKVKPRFSKMENRGLTPYNAFLREQYAMMTVGTWDLPDIRQKFKKMEWGIALDPKITRQAQWTSSKAIVINSKTRYPDKAWKLFKLFLSREFQLKMAVVSVPADRRYAKEIINTPGFDSDNYKILYEMTKYIAPTPRVAHLQELMYLFYAACEEVWLGKESPEQAMKRLKRNVLSKFENFNNQEPDL